MKKLLEIKMSVDKQNLEAFKKASKNMKVQMQYNMFKASKALVKNSLAGLIIKNRFLKTLDDLGSFSKEKIPLNTLKKLRKKNIIASNLSADRMEMLDATTLKLKNPDAYSKYQVVVGAKTKRDYMAWSKKRRDEASQSLKSPRVVGGSEQGTTDSKVSKVAKILEAFVMKLNFNLKRLSLSMVDEKARVVLST
jgi:hypothetical protein